MQEILFKAKRIGDGEWVEGYYFAKPILEKHFILLGENQWMIDRSTLSQYTGLTDKNGNRIWENDIVRKKDITPLGWARTRTCKVNFSEFGYWMITTEFGDGYWLGEFEEEQLEVIGNIFDNPELMEVE